MTNTEMVMKCDKCGLNDSCRLSEDKRLECKLSYGYKPINILSIHQALSLHKSGRNWQDFVRQMDKRDIYAWNEMCLAKMGIVEQSFEEQLDLAWRSTLEENNGSDGELTEA
jgi:hypothetical protein